MCSNSMHIQILDAVTILQLDFAMNTNHPAAIFEMYPKIMNIKHLVSCQYKVLYVELHADQINGWQCDLESICNLMRDKL